MLGQYFGSAPTSHKARLSAAYAANWYKACVRRLASGSVSCQINNFLDCMHAHKNMDADEAANIDAKQASAVIEPAVQRGLHSTSCPAQIWSAEATSGEHTLPSHPRLPKTDLMVHVLGGLFTKWHALCRCSRRTLAGVHMHLDVFAILVVMAQTMRNGGDGGVGGGGQSVWFLAS